MIAEVRGANHPCIFFRYTFLSARKDQMLTYAEQAEAASLNGSGEVRFHDTTRAPFDFAKYGAFKDGIDLIDDSEVIQKLNPGITKDAVVMMHVRKVGEY
jgi:hypothetical protein